MGCLSKSIEDYLEAIYIIKLKKKVARSKDVAKLLNINPASVSEALIKIKEAGLIEKEKYGYIDLTDKGEVLAKEVYSKHTILVHFLKDILKVDKNTALKEACAIEHELSDKTIKKLEIFIKGKVKK